MRIVHLTYSLYAGGIEMMLADIANRQSQSESVSVMVINAQIDESVERSFAPSVEIRKINRPAGSVNPIHLYRAIRMIRDLDPDIIHCHFESLTPFLHFTHGKKVLTVHGIHRKFDKRLQKYDKIFGISQGVCEDLPRRGIKSDPVLIYNGVDSSLVRKKSQYSGPLSRVICVGRLKHETKGQDILIRALHDLVHVHNIECIQVDFTGDGPSLDYLKELACDLKVEHHCGFLGHRPRNWVLQTMCEYDLLVQPSRREGFGLTIVEAMMAKVPVVVSNIPGASEVIAFGKYGYIFPPEDHQKCAGAILTAIKDYENSECENKADRACAYAESHFHIDQTVKRYLEEYRALLQSD